MSPADAPHDSSAAGGAATVLVVDDDVIVRMPISETLREAGFHVLEAANGLDALAVTVSDLPVDLLLTDLRMPGALDGFGLGLAASGARPELKVLVMSSYLPEATGARLSPFQFIAKPFTADALVDRVRAMLGAQGDASQV